MFHICFQEKNIKINTKVFYFSIYFTISIISLEDNQDIAYQIYLKQLNIIN
jgi:hypothetical protein